MGRLRSERNQSMRRLNATALEMNTKRDAPHHMQSPYWPFSFTSCILVCDSSSSSRISRIGCFSSLLDSSFKTPENLGDPGHLPILRLYTWARPHSIAPSQPQKLHPTNQPRLSAAAKLQVQKRGWVPPPLLSGSPPDWTPGYDDKRLWTVGSSKEVEDDDVRRGVGHGCSDCLPAALAKCLGAKNKYYLNFVF